MADSFEDLFQESLKNQYLLNCPAPEHCWHVSPTQPLVLNHRDELCCHCGLRRCCELGHGHFCPDRIFVAVKVKLKAEPGGGCYRCRTL